MRRDESPAALVEFRGVSRPFQQTFVTPLKSLPSFVAAIVAANQEMKLGCVTIEKVVFEPTSLNELLARYSMPERVGFGTAITGTGQQEVEVLLEAVFSEWIDFIFVPGPESFVIYADHDEYTTFFTRARGDLDRLTEALHVQGTKIVSDYQRRF
jgi:hypothetical protein